MAQIDAEPQRAGLFTLTSLEQVDSTNNYIKRLIKEGAPEGEAVLACVQTGGYGRRGHSWSSPRGGMYLSVLLRPQNHARELPTLSLVTSLAVRAAVLPFVETERCNDILIKWPNDVMVIQGTAKDTSLSTATVEKLCGISLEAIGNALCIGIGINVMRVSEEEPTKTQGYGRAYLEDLVRHSDGLRIQDVAKSVLTTLSTYYERWLAGSFVALKDDYECASLLQDRVIDIEDATGKIERGIVKGVDNAGNLLVKDVITGELIAVSAERSHILLAAH